MVAPSTSCLAGGSASYEKVARGRKGGGEKVMEDIEKMEIRLKECCLVCKDFAPSGVYGLLRCTGDRYIGCTHMNVCYKYLDTQPHDE